jgi:hypothetical protein
LRLAVTEAYTVEESGGASLMRMQESDLESAGPECGPRLADMVVNDRIYIENYRRALKGSGMIIEGRWKLEIREGLWVLVGMLRFAKA